MASTIIMYRVISGVLLMLAIISADDTWVGFGRKCNKFAPPGTPGTACNPEKNFVCMFGVCQCQVGTTYAKMQDECSVVFAKSLGSQKFGAVHERKILVQLADMVASPMLGKTSFPNYPNAIGRMFSGKDIIY